MSDEPLVSVVTPVFNGVKTIQRTIDSICAQDYPHIEHIVMDGASTDGTLAVLAANEGSLQWYSARDKGQSDAINRGFARAAGTHLTWLNADDWLMPGAISRCMEVFQTRPELGMVYGKLNLVRPDGTLIREWRGGYHRAFEGKYEDLLHWDNFIPQPGTLFSRQAWDAAGPLPTELYWSMDYYLFVKIAQNFPFTFIPFTTAALSVYPETKSASGGLERLFEYEQMLTALGSRASLIYFKIGHWYYLHDSMAQARRYFVQALIRRPRRYMVSYVVALLLKTYLGPRVIRMGRALCKTLKK
jgi:glycosyltransferase involved in cell wall biosynthesis